MKIIHTVLPLILVITLLSACSPGPKSASGFRLPDGDATRGKEVFIAMHCHACHTIQGEELPTLDIEAPVSVRLGGPVSRVKNYGNLVTSIINPSHKLMKIYPEDYVSSEGESFMPTVNEFMTVSQLIDLVAYLQGTYDVIVPDMYPYVIYNHERQSGQSKNTPTPATSNP